MDFTRHKHPRPDTDEKSYFYEQRCFRNDCCVPLSVFYLCDNYVYTKRLFDKALAEAESCLTALFPGESGVCWKMRVKPRQRIISNQANIYVQYQDDDICIVFLTREQKETTELDCLVKLGSRKRRRCYVAVRAPGYVD